MSGRPTRVVPRIGDVLEIDTPKGLGYFQYVRKEPVNGAMIRVLPGTFPERPDLPQLVVGPTSYFVFFPVGPAARRRIVRIVGTYPIPSHAERFPLMRSPNFAPRYKPERPTWWLWDGTREWRVSELDEPALHASPNAHWNDTLLANRIASGWSPADDPFGV